MKKFLIILIIAFLTINIFTLDSQHNWGDDFSAYIGQAKAIVDGRLADYAADANYRVAHSEAQVGPNLYPMGYPLILAPVVAFFGINIWAMKFVTYLFFIGSLAIVYFLFRKKIKDEYVLIIILLLAASPYFFELKQNVLSDVPAMFFLLLSVFLTERIYFREMKTERRNTYLILLGASIFASFFIRENSIVVIPFLLLIQAFERKKWLKNFSDMAIHALPYVIFLLLYLLSLAFFPASSYANHTLFNSSSLLSTAAKNFAYYTNVFAEFFGNPGRYPAIWPIYFVAGIFFFAGILKNFRKYYHYILFSVLILGLFLVFPYQQGLRYILPVIPFFLFFAILSLGPVDFKKISGLDSQKAAYVSIFFLALFFTVQVHDLAELPPPDGPFSQKAGGLFRFISENTAGEDAIAFFKPRALNLLTGRKAVYIGTAEYLKNSPIDHFIATQDVTSSETEKYLRENSRPVFDNGQFQVYNLK